VLGWAGIALALAGLAWYAYWTYADPHVEVPAPETLRFDPTKPWPRGRVLFLGDLAPTDAASEQIDRHGWGYPFAKTTEILAEFDAAVANLEAPVTHSVDPWPVPKKYVYKVDPAALPAIREAGIDAVTLANNHMNDYGAVGLADTLANLDRHGIAHFGAGPSEAAARRGLVLETAGGRIGVLGYMQNKYHWRMLYMAFALDTPLGSWPGSARLRYSDLAEDIARMRAHADVVVITIHWGQNYEPVGRDQVALGEACVDLGADAVIGHHSHQMQPVGAHRGRPIVYSLGNYAFGTRGRSTMRFGMGVALHVEGGRLVGLELVPLLTQNRIVRYRTRPPGGALRERFFDELVEGSAALGVEIERRGNRGWLELGPTDE
jgi:poly-gamma-glutamate synthesis protein (capsule biosynthesis protein)